MTTDQTDPRLTHADVERIVQLVEDAGFGYVHFELGGLELTLTRQGHQPMVPAAPAPGVTPGTSDPAPAAPPASAPAGVPAAPAPVDPAPAGAGPGATSDEVEGVVTVRSPMVGIFYRAPDPDSPPYVEVGQVVEAGDTLGLVEVMKMYTAIRAEVGGTVTDVLVGDAEAVQNGQPLVRVQAA